MVSEQAHHKGNRPQRQARSSHSLQQARRCTAHGAQWGEAHCALQEGSWLNSTRKPPPGSERLARQFEQRCLKPAGWLDQPHSPQSRTGPDDAPADDDERFIVGLVLSYYRRHPEQSDWKPD